MSNSLIKSWLLRLLNLIILWKDSSIRLLVTNLLNSFQLTLNRGTSLSKRWTYTFQALLQKREETAKTLDQFFQTLQSVKTPSPGIEHLEFKLKKIKALDHWATNQVMAQKVKKYNFRAFINQEI